MQVTTGYSQEHHDGKWSKMDVTVEEADLHRFLVEKDIDPTVHIRPAAVWTLMSAEADSFLIVRQLTQGLIDEETAKTRMSAVRATQEKIINEIKESAK